MKIRVDMNRCTGCRACEAACGFHLSGACNPAASALRILRDTVSGKISYELLPGCDLCRGRAEPLCVELCPFRAIAADRDPRAESAG